MVPPAPAGRVSDYAGVLQTAERQQLESYLAERERATGAQVAIAIFPSLEGESLEDFSLQVADKWRIGQKGLDNGVILLVFLRERKVRLEVGYGLEATIPDIVAGQIIRDVIAPRFREGRYGAGLDAAAHAIYQRIDDVRSGKAPPVRRPRQTSLPIVGFFALLVVVLIMLGMEASRSQRFVNRRGYTGGSGGWSPPIIMPMPGPGWGGRRRDDDDIGGGGFSGGGGDFGGGGASGGW